MYIYLKFLKKNANIKGKRWKNREIFTVLLGKISFWNRWWGKNIFYFYIIQYTLYLREKYHFGIGGGAKISYFG